MGIFRKTDDTRLERELRALAPQPRDELVRTLSSRIEPARRTRRVAIPKVAIVAAVTAALAVSLGAAGALGAAGGSVHSFSRSVVHLVAPPKASTSNQSASNNVVTTTTSNGQTSYENATPTHWPFQAQYGHRIPICWHGSIIYVTLREGVWYFFHGARPARYCHR